MTEVGNGFMDTLYSGIKTLSTRVESLEKVVDGDTIVLPDGSEYSLSDFGYSDTSVNVFVQDDEPTGLNSSTDVGSRWYETDNNNLLRAWDGFHWITISSGTQYHGGYGLESLGPAIVSRGLASFTIHVLGSAPSSPTHGTIWKDTSSGNAIKYWDTTSPAQWVTVTDQNTIDAVNDALSDTRADVSDNQVTVFYQIAAPGGRNNTTHRGDRWYDIGNSYLPWLWNGNLWISPAQDTTGAVTDGVPPSSSPQAVVSSGVNSLFVRWDEITNNDQVWYNIYVDTTTPVATDSSTFYGSAYGTIATILNEADGSPLLPDTTYYVKIIAIDADGFAPAGIEGSGQITKIDLARLAQEIADDIADIDTIRATADGKNTNYYQATAPTGGTYSPDDMWFNTGDGYRPHYWNGTAWTAYSYGSSSLAVGSVVAATISAGAVTVDKIAANSITADALVVGTLGVNLVMNGSFEVGVTGATHPNGWAWSEGEFSWAYFDRYLDPGAKDGQYVLRLLTQPATRVGMCCKAFPVSPGKTYGVRVWHKASANTSLHDILINWAAAPTSSGFISVFDRDGNTRLSQAASDTVWALYEGTWTAPVGAQWASLSLINDSNEGSTVYFDAADIREQSTGVMIADGAIIADKIGAGAIIAEKIDSLAVTTDKLAANAVTAGKIDTDAVTAAKIAAGAIDGKVITGATIQTDAAANTGIDFTSTGFTVYNAANAVTFQIDAATGDVLGTGTFRTGTSGQRVEMNPSAASQPEFRFYPTEDLNARYSYIQSYDMTPSRSGLRMSSARDGVDDPTGQQSLIELDYDNTFIGNANQTGNYRAYATFERGGTGGDVTLWANSQVRIFTGTWTYIDTRVRCEGIDSRGGSGGGALVAGGPVNHKFSFWKNNDPIRRYIWDIGSNVLIGPL